MSRRCFTCSCMRPRYKKLVDNIFPQIPQDGLVKSNMEKLIFFSLSSPEKLDRIGEYLYKKASRDINRKRTGYVVIAMEAMDQLLVACHDQTLNLFVESFLRMIQKLLESTEPDLQVLATTSFVRFANIEEDTPSYHRRYDFFVSKFSSMCHSNHPDPKTRTDIRLAGIIGLQGVIRKTVSDDLVENIWEPVHMDKIIPSLLYNMHDSHGGGGSVRHSVVNGGDDSHLDKEGDPRALADSCVRELMSRASFGHVRSVLKPVLKHLDLHNLWVPNDFAVRIFRTIMLSIQSQYSYAVVESLMSHLDENKESSAQIRTSIANVLSKIISISAEESVGPSVLEIINSVLGHVSMSVERRERGSEEALYRDALIHCLGEFSAHLPDYQKVEIMVFIISKVPPAGSSGSRLLQLMLLKSLLTVGRRYKNVSMCTSLPVSLLEPLLKLSMTGSVDIKIVVQQVLHTLLDRHSNAEKLSSPTLEVETLELLSEECSRSDAMFMRKYSEDVYTCLVETLASNGNTVLVVEAVYTTFALVAVELVTQTNASSYIAMIYAIQELAMSDKDLSDARRNNLHAIAVSLLVLVSNLLQLSNVKDYAYKVMLARRSGGGSCLLPPLRETYATTVWSLPPAKLLLDGEALAEAAAAAGLDPGPVARPVAPARWLADSGPLASHPTPQDAAAGSDVDSTGSTPALNRWFEEGVKNQYDWTLLVIPMQRSLGCSESFGRLQQPEVRHFTFSKSWKYQAYECPFENYLHPRLDLLRIKWPEEELSFPAMKRVLAESLEAMKESERKKQEEIFKAFRETTFQDIVNNNTVREEETLQTKLSELLNRAPQHINSPHGPALSSAPPTQPIYEVLFPELFAY